MAQNLNTLVCKKTLDVQIPRKLELEIFELQQEFSEFAKNKKYKKFLHEYEDWNIEELLSRLRILCVETRVHAYEAMAVFDKLVAKI